MTDSTSSEDGPRCPDHDVPLAKFILRGAAGQGSIDAWICPLLSEHRHEITEEHERAGGATAPMAAFLQELPPGAIARFHRAMEREKELSKLQDSGTEILPNFPPWQLERLIEDLVNVEQEQETHRIPSARRRRRRSFWHWLRRRG